MRLDKFARNSLLVLLASNISSFFNFLYQFVMLRLVTRDVFASLNSLLSLLTIISVPSLAFTLMVTKHISAGSAKNEHQELRAVWQALARQAFFFSLAVFILIVILSRHIAGFLNLGSPVAVVILGAIFFLSGIATVFNGGLQGLEKFKWLALSLVSAAFLKVAVSYILVKKMPQLEVALSGFLIALLSGILVSLWPLRFLFKEKETLKVDLKKLYFYIMPTLAISFCFAALTNIDMLLVKHFFSKTAEDYAVAQMVGKVILFIPGLVYMVIFARASSLHALNKNTKGIFKRGLLFIFCLSLAPVVLFNLFPELALGVLSPGFSPEVVVLGRVFSFAMFFLALSNALFYYQLSVERYRFIPVTASIAVSLFAVLWFLHYSPLWVISAMLFGAALIFIVNLGLVFRLS